MSFDLLTLCEIFLFSLGSACIFLATYNRRKSLKAMSWPAVPGKVISSAVLTKTYESEDGPSTTYRPEIRYEYQVNGNSYVSDVWRFGVTAASLGQWEVNSAIVKYPTGSSISVFVNPANPAEAVLDPGKTPYIAAGIVGAVFILLGLGIIVAKVMITA